MNLRNPAQINKPLPDASAMKFISFYNDEDFNNWTMTSGKSINIISVCHLIDNMNVSTYSNTTVESVSNSRADNNGFNYYSYVIKVLYQEINE